MKIAEVVNPPEVDEQVLHLRAKNKQLGKTVGQLRCIIGQQKEMARMVAAAITAAEPFKREPWQRPARPGSPVVAVIKFSDWHIGEIIHKAETEGFGYYSWRVAQARLLGIVNSFLAWVETQRAGYRIDRCVVFGEGDYISGDLHRELSVTNEFPVPVQTAHAGLLLGEAILLLSRHFAEVEVIEVGADNHGRLTPKPQFKQKAENSLSYLVHIIANCFTAKLPNVQAVQLVAMKHLAKVAGYKFLIEHGDVVRAWMGIPYYGIEREAGREARRRMNGGRGFHYQSIGHWHVPAWVAGNILINGSLSGTSEYDHGVGRHARPSQVAFLVHPKHGVFNFIPFQV